MLMKSFLLIICIFSFIATRERRCGFSRLKDINRVSVNTYKSSDRELAEQDWEGMRVFTDYSQPTDMLHKGKASQKDFEDIRKVMDKTASVLSRLLKVKRLSEPLKVETDKCDVFDLPDKAKSNGEGIPDTDLLVLVQFDTTGEFEKEGIEAAAADCIQDETYHRPIVGFIQFKPNIGIKQEKDLDYMVWLALHEMTHVLGFNDALYSSFIDPDTFATKPLDQVIAATEINNQSAIVIITKNVKERAQKHYKCSKLEGVPVEYNGGMGTAGAHWSKRYLNTEYMIGDSYGENVISEITLALLEDTGWYKVDYKQANMFEWGKDAGCSFFNTPCIDKQTEKSNFPKDFCENYENEVCSNQNVFRGFCKVVKYQSPLPDSKQFFKDPLKGGLDTLTDYCPIPIELKSEETYYAGSCRFGSKGTKPFEKVCSNCACFENTLSLQSAPLEEKQAASCFSFSCKDGAVWVEVEGSQPTLCDKKEISLKGFNGKLKCPNAKILCDKGYFYKFGSLEKY